MARVMRQGQMHQQNFTLRKYKTWKAAEAAAMKWVRKKLRELPPETARKGRMTKRNSSGVVGVWPSIDRHYQGDRVYEYCRWGGRWPECELKGGIRWSVKTYGDNDAFVLACLAVKYETVDRDWLLKKLKRIRGKKEYNEFIAKKLIDFV